MIRSRSVANGAVSCVTQSKQKTGENGMERLLIVEDDRSLNLGLCKALQAQDRQMISCLSIEDARAQLMLGDISLVLLDVNLPDGSGIDFLREIRTVNPKLPTILLTANDTDMDIVEGLEQGADDYITKPFSLAVLRARINARLRRPAGEDAVQIDHFSFDFADQRFCVDGRAVELSKTEQKLLQLLVRNRGITMSRAALANRIWPDGADYVDENALSVAVKRLRDKLGAQDYIKTVYGVGYSWVMKHE